MTESTVKSAERVLDIFEALSASPNGLSFSALHQALGVPKSSLHVLLQVLAKRGYIDLDPSNRSYTIGIRLWERSQAYQRHHGLIQEALNVMHDITQAINETTQLAILQGIENIYLAKVDSSHSLRLQSEVGRRLPAYATGLGKAQLADLDAAELARRLDGVMLQRFTPHTLVDRAVLEAELVRVHERGFSVDNQEYTVGVCCVAVPIVGAQNRTVAALSVSVPLSRATLELFSLALAQLAAGSLLISQRLGGFVPDQRMLALRDQALAKQALAALVQGGALHL